MVAMSLEAATSTLPARHPNTAKATIKRLPTKHSSSRTEHAPQKIKMVMVQGQKERERERERALLHPSTTTLGAG